MASETKQKVFLLIKNFCRELYELECKLDNMGEDMLDEYDLHTCGDMYHIVEDLPSSLYGLEALMISITLTLEPGSYYTLCEDNRSVYESLIHLYDHTLDKMENYTDLIEFITKGNDQKIQEKYGVSFNEIGYVAFIPDKNN